MADDSSHIAFRIDELAREVACRVWPWSRARGVNLGVLMQDGLPSGLCGDGRALEHGLEALLREAIEDATTTARLTVSAEGFTDEGLSRLRFTVHTDAGRHDRVEAFDLAVAPALADPGPPTGLHVLVVDDEAVSRTVLQKLLERLGARVRVATGGAEGLASLDDTIDCVLLDMSMPDLSGVEVARRIRAAGNLVPIVGVSANAFAADRQEGVEAGMNDYLKKPVRPADLARSLSRWA